MNAAEKAGEAVWEDFQDWLVSRYRDDIVIFYEQRIDKYLNDRFGNLSSSARRDMSKVLLKHLIN